MNRAGVKFILMIVFLVLVNFLSSPPEGRAQSETIWFGAAKEDITPPIGTPLSGYGKTKGKPSRGVHDPIYARAISLKRGSEYFVFTSVDLCLVDRYLRDKTIEKVRREIEIPASHIVLFAIHTHSGTGAIGTRFWQKFIMGKFNRSVFEATTSGIAKAIIASAKELVPVSVEWGEIEAGDLAENRMDERVRHSIPLKIIRFVTETDKIAGQLVFFSAHPTIFPALDYEFSADFPGVLTDQLESGTEGSVVLFANGAAADLRPNRKLRGDSKAERMERIGKALYERAKSIHFTRAPVEGVWQVRAETVKLPRVKVRAGWFTVPSVIGNRFWPRRVLFQITRLARLLFIALPGEVGSELGSEMEERAVSSGWAPFLIGFSNDYIGYVIPQRYYLDRSQYEARASFYGKRFDFFFHETVDRLMAQFSGFGQNKDEIVDMAERISNQDSPILRLRGNPYETGYQHGRLMSEEIEREKKRLYRYLGRKLRIPVLGRIVTLAALSRAWKKMEPFISYDEWMELKGLAGGSGLPFKQVKLMHALPDLFESYCSNGAYFGPATRSEKLIHIRNLDWLRELKIHRLAALIVYEPDRGNRYVNAGYYGFIGSLTGINEHGISVGQIGADSIDETFKGVPMPFLLKRVLSKASNLDEAISIVADAGRTSGFNYVIADAGAREAVAIETTAHHAQVFKDQDPKEETVVYSIPLQGAVIRADTAMDPVIRDLQFATKGNPKIPGLELPYGSSAYDIRYKKHSELVQAHYGKIDSAVARKIAQSIAPDSNIQSVVFQFPDFWIANATDALPAARAEYRHFNFEKLYDD